MYENSGLPNRSTCGGGGFNYSWKIFTYARKGVEKSPKKRKRYAQIVARMKSGTAGPTHYSLFPL